MSAPQQGYVSPWVARKARRQGIDIRAVTGTGEDGRVLLSDVDRAVTERQRAQQDAADRSARRLRSAGPPVDQPRSLGLNGRPVAEAWLVAENATVGDVSSRLRDYASERGVRLRYLTGTGPSGTATLADVRTAADRQDAEQRRAWADAFPAAPQQDPEPRVSFTASGIPVSTLQEVPPSVRKALAAAPTLGEAFRIVAVYGGLSDEDAAARLDRDRAVSALYGGAGLAGVNVPGWN